MNEASKATITAEINLQPRATGLGRLSQTLIKKNIVSEEQLQRATEIQSREPRNAKRKLIEILIDDLNVERHAIFVEMSRMYGFQIIDLKNAVEDRARIEFIKNIVYTMNDEVSNELLSKKILLFK